MSILVRNYFRKFVFGCLVFILLTQNSISQNEYLNVGPKNTQRDTLKKLLAAAKDDKSKVNYLSKLFGQYIWVSPDSSLSYVQQQIILAKKLNSNHELSNALIDYGAFFSIVGNYSQAIYYGLEGLKTAEASKDILTIVKACDYLSATYTDLNDYEHAIYYGYAGKSAFDEHFSPAENFDKFSDTISRYGSLLYGLASTYDRFNKADSALKYLNIVNNGIIRLFGHIDWPAIPYLYGNVYSKTGDPLMALQYYHEGLKLAERNDIQKDAMDICNGAAQLFKKINQLDSSIFYSYKVLEAARHAQYPIVKLEALNLLAEIYKSQHNMDSAFKYLELAATTKNTLFNQQKIMQIQSLTFDEKLRQIKQREEATKETQRIIIITVSFFALIIIITFFIWNRIKQLNIRHQLIELEARALRAQMNPHFIFNCLNSIKSLIQKQDVEKSVTYLTTFSKLIRTLLNNADKREITLYDEIETCKLYLQLESMRFDSRFTYVVNTDSTVDLKSILVPALIIQPFIENAIWHGIVPGSSDGKVILSALKCNGNVQIIIDDNGIGREASRQNMSASELSTHQSRGVNLTQSRLKLDSLLQQRKASIETIDKKDENGKAAGTRVVIRLAEEV